MAVYFSIDGELIYCNFIGRKVSPEFSNASEENLDIPDGLVFKYVFAFPLVSLLNC